MKEHRFLNKVDFGIHPSLIPNTNEGNLKLYRLFSLIRDSFELKSLDDVVGFPDSLENHLIYYKNLVNTMELRGLTVPRSTKSLIEKALSVSMKIEKFTEPVTIYHCPTCGSKLTKLDIAEFKCGECHGRLPGYTEHVLQKPLGPFPNWDTCMEHMTTPKSKGGGGYDEETAKKVCGSMELHSKEPKPS